MPWTPPTPPDVKPYKPRFMAGGLLAKKCCCPEEDGGYAEDCPPIPVPPCPKFLQFTWLGFYFHCWSDGDPPVWEHWGEVHATGQLETIEGDAHAYVLRAENGNVYNGIIDAFVMHGKSLFHGNPFCDEWKYWPDDKESMELHIQLSCEELPEMPQPHQLAFATASIYGECAFDVGSAFKARMFEGEQCLQDLYYEYWDFYWNPWQEWDPGTFTATGNPGIGGSRVIGTPPRKSCLSKIRKQQWIEQQRRLRGF